MSALLPNTPTRAPEELSKNQIKQETQHLIGQVAEFQKILYAQSKYSLLIILQGLDASGKDGLVNTIFHGINPLGCDVIPFKAPTEEERSYDFIWRVHKKVPPKGQIYVFNRSHYEDVLVPRVENRIDLPTVHRRFEHINNFEKLLTDHHTTILKFYLHISHEEQKERLEERKTNPKKFWKHSDGDWETRKKWEHYLKAYEDIFEHCGPAIPWTIVPSDQNWYKEYIVSKKIRDTLASMDLKYPAFNERG